MNYNEYNLGQLLELALRVPEVGAVNFNILYCILKTIIEKEGLEEVKPIDILDSFISDPEPSIKRSLSDESLVSAKDKVKGRYNGITLFYLFACAFHLTYLYFPFVYLL